MKLTIKEVELISKLDHGLLLSNEIIRAMAAQILKDQEALEFAKKKRTFQGRAKSCFNQACDALDEIADKAKAALLPKE